MQGFLLTYWVMQLAIAEWTVEFDVSSFCWAVISSEYNRLAIFLGNTSESSVLSCIQFQNCRDPQNSIENSQSSDIISSLCTRTKHGYVSAIYAFC